MFFGRNCFELDLPTLRHISDLAVKFMGRIDQETTEYARRLVFKFDGFQSEPTSVKMRQTLRDLRVVSAELSSVRCSSTCNFKYEVVLTFGCTCMQDQSRSTTIDLRDLSASFHFAVASLEVFIARFWEQRSPPACLIGRAQEAFDVFIGMRERELLAGTEAYEFDGYAAIDWGWQENDMMAPKRS